MLRTLIITAKNTDIVRFGYLYQTHNEKKIMASNKAEILSWLFGKV